MTTFNINGQLRFRLTVSGERHLRDHLAREARLCNAASPFSRKIADDESMPKPLPDGRVQMTAWEVFHIFGPQCFIGADPMFERNELEVIQP
ncbi:hypothetical protein ABMY26_06915 (plasmid) [Azospirillum sp. HJ39]|uniref:hypothetical protein n=1 Tax=Azospirillum sp. HJ39 TaxID=3159496 RepID=UPI003555ED1A